jgi:hypothetical protein
MNAKVRELVEEAKGLGDQYHAEGRDGRALLRGLRDDFEAAARELDQHAASLRRPDDRPLRKGDRVKYQPKNVHGQRAPHQHEGTFKEWLDKTFGVIDWDDGSQTIVMPWDVVRVGES